MVSPVVENDAVVFEPGRRKDFSILNEEQLRAEYPGFVHLLVREEDSIIVAGMREGDPHAMLDKLKTDRPEVFKDATLVLEHGPDWTPAAEESPGWEGRIKRNPVSRKAR